jgi:hypothetical protein
MKRNRQMRRGRRRVPVSLVYTKQGSQAVAITNLSANLQEYATLEMMAQTTSSFGLGEGERLIVHRALLKLRCLGESLTAHFHPVLIRTAVGISMTSNTESTANSILALLEAASDGVFDARILPEAPLKGDYGQDYLSERTYDVTKFVREYVKVMEGNEAKPGFIIGVAVLAPDNGDSQEVYWELEIHFSKTPRGLNRF